MLIRKNNQIFSYDFFIYIPGFHTSSNIKFINIFMLLDGYGLAPNQFYLYI
jgi:hypothetical protein